MAIDTINVYKKKKKEWEKELNRELTEDERSKLMGDVISSAIEGVKIPDGEISDLEINGLKD
jgi:hypothetical protein